MGHDTVSSKPLHVVQFTDTHFFGSTEGRLMGVDTALTFEEVKNLAIKERGVPDFYLLTGDLSQDETAESYSRFARAVSDLKSPMYYLPGNHDVSNRMVEAFSTPGVPFVEQTHVTKGEWHVVLLDSHVEGQVPGYLSDVQLAHLQSSLEANSDKHVLVGLHHHPIPIGCEWLDNLGVNNAEGFFALIDRYTNVRAVLFGHIHQQFESSRKGVRYMATPSTCVQFAPNSVAFGVDSVPPGYRWLELYPDGTVRTGVSRAANVAAGLDVASAGY